MYASTQGERRASRFANKAWREVSRPFRQLSRRVERLRTPKQRRASSARSITTFDPRIATVEPEGVPLIEQLVRESKMYPGPIIEIGTLLGITTTTMALAKAPEQKIITVDLYCWNPWGITPVAHASLAGQVLNYLEKTGHVERVVMDKDEFYETYSGPAPAMVFLDAMHDYENTKKDIAWAQRVGARIISGHDYCDLHPGVIEIVDEMGGPRLLAGSVWAL